LEHLLDEGDRFRYKFTRQLGLVAVRWDVRGESADYLGCNPAKRVVDLIIQVLYQVYRPIPAIYCDTP
jgi:hypothetical protein